MQNTTPSAITASLVQLTLDPSERLVFVLDHRWTDLLRIAREDLLATHHRSKDLLQQAEGLFFVVVVFLCFPQL